MPNPDEFPPYAYVPGGPWPHPTRSPEGHSFGRSTRHAPEPLGTSEAFWRGVAWFDAGYYWESHEVWEGLWHAHGRKGPAADFLKALIKLAAAGVKAREGQLHGIVTHAARAAGLFEDGKANGGQPLDLERLAQAARAVVAQPPIDPGPKDAAVTRVFAFRLADFRADS